jgi:hypothetical protein
MPIYTQIETTFTWDEITGKPSTFPPEAHTHPLSELTQSSATSGQVPSWNGTAWVPTTPSSGNPFDQSLNTTDSPTFNKVTTNNGIDVRYFDPEFGEEGAYRALIGASPAGVSFESPVTFYTQTITAGNSNLNVTAEHFNLTGRQTISAPANTSALTASYSVTGTNTTPLLNLSGTWNTTGVARGILLNITDQSSASTSRLLDVQSSGTSAFSINKFGQFTGSGGFSFTPAANTGTFSFVSGSTGSVQFNSSAGNIFTCRADAIKTFNFASTFAVGWNSDTYLYRDAANTLAQRNGTNAQAFRLYGTFTDASNGRRLDIRSTTGGIFTLTATGNGTGASGNLLKLTQPILLPSSSVTLATNGDLAFEATSNTSLTIMYRGSDGTTRSASLTLT